MADNTHLVGPGLATAGPPPSYVYGLGEKLQFVLASLRQRVSPRKHLFAGPFAGEFGYELMQWQGYVRARRPFYQQVHVLTYPGRDYLYEGCHVHHHSIELRTAGYGYGLLSPEDGRKMAENKAAELGLRDFDIFSPALLCTQYHKRLFWRQDFRLFEEPVLEGRMRDVAFHFRAVKKEGPDHAKNYSPELARELVERCQEAGLSVLCIGHPDYSISPEGAEDCRSVDLRETVAAVSSARIVAGENSGPMHLANLCGKPTLLWAQDQWRIDYSLRWNPFEVPIYTAANTTSQPAPEVVFEKLTEALGDLDARTEKNSRPVYTLPARAIAYF